MLLSRSSLLLVVLVPLAASAQRESTRNALTRVEETLLLRIEQGGFAKKDLTPAIVVSVTPAFEETRGWYPTAAIATLGRVFGSGSLRACEACMSPRLSIEETGIEHVSVAPTIEEIIRIDDRARGDDPPARVAIYLDETTDGVSLRIVELSTSRIVMAENFDPMLKSVARTHKNFTLTQDLERRIRHDSITHTFIDFTFLGGPHFSLDWTEQWGDTNANLSGFSMSAFDPVFGIGGAYYRVVPKALNIAVGGKLMMSVPTALISALTGQTANVIDPILTAVFVVRVPILSSNYAVNLTASTNGRFGVGLSLMNLTLLPVLP